MSTRSSIIYDHGQHLFEDVGMGYEHDGLHLDIDAARMESESQYGGFELDEGSLHVRLPLDICEAIADFVDKRRGASVRLAKAEAELAYLRTVVTEKFARDIEVAVRPEDAADVAKWARNPEAVRYLMKCSEARAPNLPDECRNCGAETGHLPDCRVFLAWAALDDSRAAEAIGAAFDSARPVRRGADGLTADEQRRLYGRVIDVEPIRSRADALMRPEVAYRLASESEQAARERTFTQAIASDMNEGVGITVDPSLPPADAILEGYGSGRRYRVGVVTWQLVQRATSDARGMEAVEAEARAQHQLLGPGNDLWRRYVIRPDGMIEDTQR